MNFASWGPLGSALGGLLGHLGGFLGHLGPSGSRKGRNAKSFQKSKGTQCIFLLGPSWECSWRPLGASWRPLGPSGGHLERLGTIFRRLGALLDRLRDVSEPCWCAPGALWGASPGSCPGYFSSGDPQGPPRARELEILLTSYRRS